MENAPDWYAQTKSHCDGKAQFHAIACEIYARRATWLTLANVGASILILFIASNDAAKGIMETIIVKFAMLYGISECDVREQKLADVAIGFLSMFAVFTAAAQYLLKYEERNLIHKFVSIDYENISRKLQRLIAQNKVTDEEMHRTNKALNMLARHSPPISNKIAEEQNGSSLSRKVIRLAIAAMLGISVAVLAGIWWSLLWANNCDEGYCAKIITWIYAPIGAIGALIIRLLVPPKRNSRQ